MRVYWSWRNDYAACDKLIGGGAGHVFIGLQMD